MVAAPVIDHFKKVDKNVSFSLVTHFFNVPIIFERLPNIGNAQANCTEHC
jgi:hypothetical protein